MIGGTNPPHSIEDVIVILLSLSEQVQAEAKQKQSFKGG